MTTLIPRSQSQAEVYHWCALYGELSENLPLPRFRALVDRDYRTHKSVAFHAGELGVTSMQLNRVCREVLGKLALGAINARLW